MLTYFLIGVAIGALTGVPIGPVNVAVIDGAYRHTLRRGMAVGLSVGAEHVDDDYADYYFSVSPAGSIASGLPTFQADGGWKSVGAFVLLGVDFDGELANGGLAGFVSGGYTRLLGDAKRTPLTSIRGDADQWLAGAGLAFTF